MTTTLIMLAALAGLVLLVLPLGGWRIAGRMTVLGLAVIGAELVVIQLIPHVGALLMEVTR